MADQKDRNVRFETVNSVIKEFGQNNFIELSRGKAITGDGENEFLTIARGYFRHNFEKDEPERIYKKRVTIPDIPEVKAFIKENIENI